MWRSDQPVHCSNKDLRLERHITELATLRTKCGAPHFVREFRSYGSVRGAPSNGRPYRETTIDGFWPTTARPRRHLIRSIPVIGH